MEGREDALFAISLATIQGSVPIGGINLEMMTIITTLGATSTAMMKGMIGPMEKEKGM